MENQDVIDLDEEAPVPVQTEPVINPVAVPETKTPEEEAQEKQELLEKR